LAEPAALAEVFAPLIGIYEPDPKGRPLVDLLRADWLMFEGAQFDNTTATELLTSVVGVKIVATAFSPSQKYQSDGLARWEKLRSELMHQNRYFPEAQLDLERLEELLGLLKADESQTVWYRARLELLDVPFTALDMGAPPARVASHGRANPAGIPYLYLASAAETAASEIRPHAGETACVAEFTLPGDLALVDLRAPRRIVSPFDLQDEDEIGLLRSDIGFLERLGDELTRPVVPHSAPFDYVPSQYLCEYIKKCGYAGVLYRSSVSAGFNLALFDPGLAKIGALSRQDIAEVSVKIRLHTDK
jgi:hypothetical protein